MFSTVSCSELLKELNFLINSKYFQEKGSNWCCIWRRLINVVDWATNHIRYFKPLKHLKSPWHQNESFVAWIMFYNRQDHANTWLSSSSLRRCSIKKFSLIFRKIYRKTGVSLWILQDFIRAPFYRTPPNECFCVIKSPL